MAIDPEELRNFMSSVDISSAAAQNDKADECRFFLELARAETGLLPIPRTPSYLS